MQRQRTVQRRHLARRSCRLAHPYHVDQPLDRPHASTPTNRNSPRSTGLGSIVGIPDAVILRPPEKPVRSPRGNASPVKRTSAPVTTSPGHPHQIHNTQNATLAFARPLPRLLPKPLRHLPQFRKLLHTLAVLDRSLGPRDTDLPGLRPHPLKGELQGHYAVAVSDNRRVTFRFEDGDSVDVDYVDYH